MVTEELECQFDPAWVAAAAPSRGFKPRASTGKQAHFNLTQTLRKLAVEKV
jgi:hypothetical protein